MLVSQRLLAVSHRLNVAVSQPSQLGLCEELHWRPAAFIELFSCGCAYVNRYG